MNTKKRATVVAALIGAFVGLAPHIGSAHEGRGRAQELNIPPAPAIGQQNVATADLLVSHPDTTPCVVTLFQSDTFDNYAPRPFSYTPPPDCPGPWAKVVFVAHFNENPGVQYDRTAYVFLGDANLYFGTTPEPTSTVGPVWTVERDVTAYSALLGSPQSGAATIFNIVNSTYTGVIHGSGYLYFYPLAQRDDDGASPDPRHGDEQSGDGRTGTLAPSAVYPLNTGNQPAYLDTPSTPLSKQLVFPRNMTHLYLAITAQSQIGDEFWYTCVPNAYAGELQSCGNTGYRQVVVQVDGRTVAYAPVSPWIYTGGIDPFLWQPTPGAQTLDFRPYRVDLTPLLGELDNGQPHTISVSVYNDGNYFSVAANLLAYQDKAVSALSGAVTEVDVPPLAPEVTSDLSSGGGGIVSGSVSVRSTAHTLLAGYLDLPQGPRWTSVRQNLSFANDQNFSINDTVYDQQIALSSRVDTLTRVRGAGAYGDGRSRTRTRTWRFPLSLNYDQVLEPDGSYDITTTVAQRYRSVSRPEPAAESGRALLDQVKAQDTLVFDPSTGALSNSNQTSSQHFEYQSRGHGEPQCYNRTITNAANAVTAVSDSHRCKLLAGGGEGR